MEHRKETKEVKVTSMGTGDEIGTTILSRQRKTRNPAGDFLNYNVQPIYSHLLGNEFRSLSQEEMGRKMLQE